jgi:uncharacterized membrane protein
MRTDRLQALADGVFAIALTLLVLELPAPAHDTTDLAADLVHAWPFYAAYVVSFVTLGIVWVNHHRLMDAVARADRTLLELNLLLLLFVGLVPWPTGLLAEHLRDHTQSSAAAVTYGVVMTLMSGTFTVIWLRLTHRSSLLRDTDRSTLRRAVRRSAIGPIAYAISTGIAVVSAPVAFALFALTAVFFAVSGRGDAPALPDA